MSNLPDSQPPSRARGTPQNEAPFVWVSVDGLRRIREHTGSSSAIAVYIGLACIANEERSPVFQAKIVRIASVSALRYRATLTALDLLQKAGVISSHGAENNPQGKFYTLLSLCKKGRSNLVKKGRTTYALKNAKPVPTGLKNVTLSKERELLDNKTGEEMNNANPQAALPARLEAAGAAGIDIQQPVINHGPRRW